MKLKYYLRGVGTGILFATIILFISYSYKMSDGQIKKRAEELGMVMSTEEQGSSNVVDNNTSESNTTNPSDEQTNGSEENSEKPSGEEQTSEKPSDDEPTTEEPTTEEPTTDTNTVITCTITVTNKTRSQHVARQLEEAGIIEDADDFNDYLVDNKYDRKIQNGTYTFTKGMTYKEMAEYLTS